MPSEFARHRFIVDLPAGIARQAESMIGPGEAYESMSALVAVALANQVQLERAPSVGSQDDAAALRGEPGVSTSQHQWIERPAGDSPLLANPVPATGPLSSFTNRLAPLIAAVRVVAALQRETGGPVPWGRLVDQGALTARQVGLQIRQQDERAGRRGRRRRWTGWPVGTDEAASLARFRSHFLGRIDREPEDAPLLALGLIGLVDGEVALTLEGWQFAACPTPILNESPEEQPLASEQRLILARSLSRMPEEWSRVDLALRALAENDGDPMALERVVTGEEPTWTESMVASFRSGIIGRMADAGLVSVDVDTGRAYPVHGAYAGDMLVQR